MFGFNEAWNQFQISRQIDQARIGSEEYIPIEFAVIEEWGETQFSRRRASIPGMDDRDVRWVPFVENKVSLADGTEMSASYINLTEGLNTGYNHFIASQAPLKGNLSLFWKMAWETNVEQIVMVTEMTDNGVKELCYPYWPQDKSNNLVFINGMEIQLLDEQKLLAGEKEHIYIRRFLVSLDGESRIVVHYWYRNWPDQTAPAQTLTLLTLVETVQKDKQSLNSDAPILVHCAGGVGRSGTFIAGYHLKQRKDLGELPDHIFDLVAQLRWQRPKMVSKPDQYKFCYKILNDLKSSAY